MRVLCALAPLARSSDLDGHGSGTCSGSSMPSVPPLQEYCCAKRKDWYPFGTSFEPTFRPTDRFRGSENGCSLSLGGRDLPLQFDREVAPRGARDRGRESPESRRFRFHGPIARPDPMAVTPDGMPSSFSPASSTTSLSRPSRRCAIGASTPTPPQAAATAPDVPLRSAQRHCAATSLVRTRSPE